MNGLKIGNIIWTVLLLASTASAKHGDVFCSTCVKVESLCHNITHLLTFDAPFRKKVLITKLGLLRSENRLYYAYESSIDNPDSYKISYVDLDDHNIKGHVTGLKKANNFWVFDIDQKNNIVYVGSYDDGIYNLDTDNKAIFFSSKGDQILSLFYRGNVYFVVGGENVLKEKRGKDFRTYDVDTIKNVNDFIMDQNNHVVFLNNTGLYVSKFKTDEVKQLSKQRYMRGLTISLDGIVYAWWIDTIYKVNIENDILDSTLEKVAEIEALGSMTFDNSNNIIFNSGPELFRLTPTNTSRC